MRKSRLFSDQLLWGNSTSTWQECVALDRLLGVCVSFCACRLAMMGVQTHAIFPEHAACERDKEREGEVLACRIWTSQPRNSRPSLDSDLVLMSFFFSNTNLLCSNPQILLYPQTACVFKRTATHTHARQAHIERKTCCLFRCSCTTTLDWIRHRDSEMVGRIISFFLGVQRSFCMRIFIIGITESALEKMSTIRFDTNQV